MAEQHYVGREQTLVKHRILQRYLGRLAHIIGPSRESLTYIDCFSGPWNVRSPALEDSSFAIAVAELRKARDTHAKGGHALRLRCLFLEKDPESYAQLRSFAENNSDIEIQTRNAALGESVGEICAFVKAGGRATFPFLFIDPTGWTGFELEMITPLLRLDPGEAMINFMTGHISRFLESPDEATQLSLERLFGSPDFRERIRGLDGQDREDAALEKYTQSVQAAGGFPYACRAIVLHPEVSRTHFNLIYLTRHPKGVETFKDVEKQSMAEQERTREEVQERKRTSAGQTELFEGEHVSESVHYDTLRDRYLSAARRRVLDELQRVRRLPYDAAWTLVWCDPLVWESDLKGWVREWVGERILTLEGMGPHQRVPQREKGNILVWK